MRRAPNLATPATRNPERQPNHGHFHPDRREDGNCQDEAGNQEADVQDDRLQFRLGDSPLGASQGLGASVDFLDITLSVCRHDSGVCTLGDGRVEAASDHSARQLVGAKAQHQNGLGPEGVRACLSIAQAIKGFFKLAEMVTIRGTKKQFETAAERLKARAKAQ